ncbi:hypothetical protein Bca101_017361 [Brassica carinata]
MEAFTDPSAPVVLREVKAFVALPLPVLVPEERRLPQIHLRRFLFRSVEAYSARRCRFRDP